MFYWAGIVATALILDLIIGDPQYSFHPIRLVGKLIEWVEGKIRPHFKECNQSLFQGGVITVVIVIAVCLVVVHNIIRLAYIINPTIGWIVQALICYVCLSTGSLKSESMKVYKPLQAGDVEGGRKAVSMIVGRDTTSLDEKGITKATVETIAENTADGVIGPLFYMIFFGAVGGFVYKAINTMDSMLGYKNDKYLYFGRAAAKLDDIANYIPARLAAVFMIIASGIAGFDSDNAVKIYKRDKNNHQSPNSAHTEAVCAGALNIQLAGNAYYFGKLCEKPTIGDTNRPVTIEDIPRANKLMIYSSVVSAVILLAVDVVLNIIF